MQLYELFRVPTDSIRPRSSLAAQQHPPVQAQEYRVFIYNSRQNYACVYTLHYLLLSCLILFSAYLQTQICIMYIKSTEYKAIDV